MIVKGYDMEGKLVERSEPLNPLGACFDAASFQIIFGDTPQDARLVHALGIANQEGQEGDTVAHAWIEFKTSAGQTMAYDPTWGLFYPAEWYAKSFQISHRVEYTAREACDLWVQTDYPGPWDSQIKAITDASDERRASCKCS